MSIETIIYQLAIIKFIRIHCISMKTGVFISWKAGMCCVVCVVIISSYYLFNIYL